MARTDFLVSLSALADHLGADVSDPRVSSAARRASARFRAAVGTPITAVDSDVSLLDAHGGRSVLLPHAPVRAVHEVVSHGQVVTDVEWSQDGMLYRATGWPRGYRAVRVTYDHGYVEVPEDIQSAVLAAAVAEFSRFPGVQSMTVGGESITFATASVGAGFDAWSQVVDSYRVGQHDRP